jgi:hypothetical protein
LAKSLAETIRVVLLVEGKQTALVVRHEVVGLAPFGQGQEKVVRGIGRAFHERQLTDGLGELLDLVD